MAKKKKAKKKKTTLDVIVDEAVEETVNELMEVTEIPSLETRVGVVEKRIDRIVDAISKSKNVKGM
jgi:hypothetical protein